jgi:hypothetical protein
MTRRARILVWTTWILIAFAISGPALELLDPLVHHLPSFVAVLFGPFALLAFLDYAFGKVVCVALAFCTVLVLLSGGINWWVKIAITVSAAVTCYVTPHWVEKVKHLW